MKTKKAIRLIPVLILLGLLSHLGAAPQFIAEPQALPLARQLGNTASQTFGYILKSTDSTIFEPRSVTMVVRMGATVVHTEVKPDTFTPPAKSHTVKFYWNGTVDATGLPAPEGAYTLTVTYKAITTSPPGTYKSVPRVDPYYIDGTGPVISNVVPSNPEWLEEGQGISGTITDPWAGVNFATLVVEVDNQSFAVGSGVTVNGSNFSVSAGTFNANLHTLRISVSDKVGNPRVWESFFRGTDDPLPLMSGNGPMENPIGTNGAFYTGIVGGAQPTFIKAGGLNAQVNVTMDVASIADYASLRASVDAAYAVPSNYSMISAINLHTARALIDLNSTSGNDPYNATVQTSWGLMELDQARITPFLNRHGLSSVRYQITDRFGASFWNVRPTTDFKVYVISGDNTLAPNVSSAKALYDWLENEITTRSLTGVRPVALSTFHEVEDFDQQTGMKHVFDIPVSAFRYGATEKNFILLRTSGKAQVLTNLDFLNDVLESNEVMPGGNENRTFPTGEPYVPGPGGVHQKWEEQYEGGVSAFPDYLTFNGLVGGRALTEEFRYGGALYANRDVQVFAQPGSRSGAVNYGFGFAQGGGEGYPYPILQNLISTVSGQMGSFTNLFVSGQSGEITGLNGAVERGNGSTQYYVAATQYRAWVTLDPAVVSAIPSWGEVLYHQYDNLLNHPRDPPGGWQGGWNTDGISSEYRSQPNVTEDGAASLFLIHRYPTGANAVAVWQDVWNATTETTGAPGVRAYKLSKVPTVVDVQTGERMWRYPVPVSELDQAPGGVNLLVWVDLQGTQADIADYLNRHHFGTSQHIPNKQENYSVGEPYNPDYLRIRSLAPRAPLVGISAPVAQAEYAATVNPLARWSVTSDIVASETVDVYAILVSPTGETRATIALNAVPGVFTWTPALIPSGASLMKIVVTSDATGLTTVSRTPFRVSGIAGQGAQLEALYRMEVLNGGSGSETTPCENGTMSAMQVAGGQLVAGALAGSANAVSLDQGEKGLVTESRSLGQAITLGAWIKPLDPASFNSVVQSLPSGGGVEFPQTSASIGDIDFDGVEDVVALAAGAPSNQNGHVYSGKNLGLIGSGLREFSRSNFFYCQSSPAGYQGTTGGLTQDGVADFAVAMYGLNENRPRGWVTFYSGAQSGGNFGVIAQVTKDNAPGFGYGLCNIGDLDGDGRDEIMVASHDEAQWGRDLLVISSTGFKNGGNPVYTAPAKIFRYGLTMRHIGDTDGDGLREFALAGQSHDVLIYEISPSFAVTLKATHVFPEDVGRTMEVLTDRMGVSHLVLGRWGGESFYILNIRTGTYIEVLKSAAGISDTSTQFGWNVGNAGDYDGDGLDDVVTAYRRDSNITDRHVIFTRSGVHLTSQDVQGPTQTTALDVKGFTRMVRTENGSANSVLSWVAGTNSIELVKWASDLTNLTDASGRNIAFLQWHRTGKLVGGTVATSDRVISTETVPSGSWRQVDLRIDADTERFDLNIGSNIYSIPTPKALAPLTAMARLHVGGGTSMQADEVGLWSRVLTDTEISEIQANPVNSGTSAPVVAFVSLTPASGSFLTSVPPIVATLNNIGVSYDATKIFVTVDGVTYHDTLNIQANAPPRTVTLASYGDGTPVNVVCQVADNFGNVFLANTSFSVDGHAPVFTDDHLISGSYFKSTGPSFSVRCVDAGSGLNPASVEISVDGGAFTATGVSVAGDRVFVTLSGLSDEAPHAVRFRGADVNGNSNGTAPFEVSFFVDTLSPQLDDFFPVSGGHLAVEGDFGSSIADFNFDPGIAGSRIVTVDYPGTSFFDVTNHAGLTISPTNWLHTGLTQSQLVPGQVYTVFASVRDAAGNWGYGQTTFTVAVAPQIVSLDPANGGTSTSVPMTVSGAFATGGAYAPLNTTRCQVTLDGVIQTGVVFTDSGFTFNPGAPFNADGPHTMVVRIENIFGYSASATSSFTRDANGPVIAPSSFSDGGLVITGDAVVWSITDAISAVASAQVRFDTGSFVALTPAGTGLYSHSGAGLGFGLHTYEVQAFDALGNMGLRVGSFTMAPVGTVPLTVEQTAPVTTAGQLDLLCHTAAFATVDVTIAGTVHTQIANVTGDAVFNNLPIALGVLTVTVEAYTIPSVKTTVNHKVRYAGSARVWELDDYYRATGHIQNLSTTKLADALDDFETVGMVDGDGFELYQYDDANNITSVSHDGVLHSGISNNMNELQSIGPIRDNMVYDDVGRLTSFTADGVLRRLTWNLKDELIKVEKGPDVPGLKTVAEYGYHPDGMRAWKKVYAADGTTITKWEHYYGVGMSVNEVYAVSAGVESADPTKEFIYEGLDRPVVMFANVDTNAGTGFQGREAYYFHSNPRGDVYALTNEVGAVVERYTYSAYGAVTVQSASYATISTSAFGNVFLNGGSFHDFETGFDQMRFRYYDPVMRGFLSRDLMEDDSTGNLYAPYERNPGTYSDPWGLMLVAIDGSNSKETVLYEDLRTGVHLPEKNIAPLFRGKAMNSFIYSFYNDYKAKDNEKKIYASGPNTLGSDTEAIFEGLLKQILEEVEKNPCEEINIVGHSRGGHIANELARALGERGIKVNFVGAYDPVDMTPGFGDGEDVPENVEHGAYAYSDSSVKSRAYFNRVDDGSDDDERIGRRPFKTTHSGMGGDPHGGDARGLNPPRFTISRDQRYRHSADVDKWIRDRATKAGIKFNNNSNWYVGSQYEKNAKLPGDAKGKDVRHPCTK